MHKWISMMHPCFQGLMTCRGACRQSSAGCYNCRTVVDDQSWVNRKSWNHNPLGNKYTIKRWPLKWTSLKKFYFDLRFWSLLPKKENNRFVFGRFRMYPLENYLSSLTESYGVRYLFTGIPTLMVWIWGAISLLKSEIFGNKQGCSICQKLKTYWR